MLPVNSSTKDCPRCENPDTKYDKPFPPQDDGSFLVRFDCRKCGIFTTTADKVWPNAKDPNEKPDLINHPPHYTQGGIECIDAIKAALGIRPFIDFLRGQILKYIWRGPHKDTPLENYKKAQFYLDRLIKELE